MHCNFIKWKLSVFFKKRSLTHILLSAWTGATQHLQVPWKVSSGSSWNTGWNHTWNKEFQTQVKLNFLGVLIRNGFFPKPKSSWVQAVLAPSWQANLSSLVFRISRALNISILFMAELCPHHLFLLVFHQKILFFFKEYIQP